MSAGWSRTCTQRGALFAVSLALLLGFSVSTAAAVGLTGDPYEPNDTTATATQIQADGVDHIQYCDAVSGPVHSQVYGADDISFPAVAGELYSVAVWSEGYYGFGGDASVIDADGQLLAETRRFYTSVRALQTHTFFVTPQADGPVYLAFTWMSADTLVPYHVKVARHDRPVITGTVRHAATGEPIEGAFVQAWLEPFTWAGQNFPTSGDAYVTTTTASDGTYRLIMPKPGRVVVHFDDTTGTMIGEWYYSNPLYSGLRSVQSIEDSVAVGVDGTLIDAARLVVRMVRADTGEPIVGLGFSAHTDDSDGFGGDYIYGPLSDANGFAVLPGLDPRKLYDLCPWIDRRGLLLPPTAWFTPTPGETATITLSFLPASITTLTDAQPVYWAPATISMTTTGNVAPRYTFYKLDGGGWIGWGVPLYVSEMGPHTLSYFSGDIYGNEEPVSETTFSLVAETTCSLDASPATLVRYGQACTLIGRARRVSFGDAALAGEAIVLEKSSNGKTGWSAVTTLTASPSGEVTYGVVPGAAVSYRLRFPGRRDWYGGSTSGAVRLAPITPASNGTPSTPASIATLRHGKSFTIYGYVIRHTAGTYPVTLQLYRYQSGHWLLRKSTTAKAFNMLTFSKYSDSTSVPYSGKWRVRARHKVGTKYLYSGYRTFTAS